MSPGFVFEESGFNGSLSGLSRQNAAHVDPGVTCSALPYGRRKIDDSSRVTNGVMLVEDDRRGVVEIKKGMTVSATSLAW